MFSADFLKILKYEIILYCDARSKKHQIVKLLFHAERLREGRKDRQKHRQDMTTRFS